MTLCLITVNLESVSHLLQLLEHRVTLPLDEATRCVPYDPDGPSCPVGTCLTRGSEPMLQKLHMYLATGTNANSVRTGSPESLLF